MAFLLVATAVTVTASIADVNSATYSVVYGENSGTSCAQEIERSIKVEVSLSGSNHSHPASKTKMTNKAGESLVIFLPLERAVSAAVSRAKGAVCRIDVRHVTACTVRGLLSAN
mgnify:CR=1 FL=1